MSLVSSVNRKVRISFGEISLLEDGLVYAKAFQNTEMSLEMAKELCAAVCYITEERPHSSVIDISGLTYVAKDAREWLRDTTNQMGVTVSVALITNSFASKAIANLVLKMSRPSYPMRIFDNLDSAELWALKNYTTYMACQELIG